MTDVHLKTVVVGLHKYADRRRKKRVHSLFRRQQFKVQMHIHCFMCSSLQP